MPIVVFCQVIWRIEYKQVDELSRKVSSYLEEVAADQLGVDFFTVNGFFNSKYRLGKLTKLLRSTCESSISWGVVRTYCFLQLWEDSVARSALRCNFLTVYRATR